MNGLHCAFTGRLSRDPESKYTSTGKAMLTLSIAVDENIRQTEQRPEAETTWCQVVCWEELADRLAEMLKKGALVYVEGRLKLDRWTPADGQQLSGLTCSTWTIQPVGQIGRQRPQQHRPDDRHPVTAGRARCDEFEEVPF